MYWCKRFCLYLKKSHCSASYKAVCRLVTCAVSVHCADCTRHSKRLYKCSHWPKSPSLIQFTEQQSTMATAQDFLNSKSWCHNMEEYVFKKADLNKDGHICSEDRDVARGRFRDFALKKQRVTWSTRGCLHGTGSVVTTGWIQLNEPVLTKQSILWR